MSISGSSLKTANAFQDHLIAYYVAPHDEKSGADPRIASRTLVSEYQRGIAHSLTRLFIGFKPFLSPEQVLEYERQIESVALDQSMPAIPAAKNDYDLLEARAYTLQKLLNKTAIKQFVETRVQTYFNQLFDIDLVNNTINLKKDIADRLGITEDLYNEFGKIKILTAIYDAFINEFLFQNSSAFEARLRKKTNLHEKHAAFEIYRNIVANEQTTLLFKPFLEYSDRYKEAFDSVYNPNREYQSRAAAFFGWKAPYVTALLDIPLNIAKGVTELFPSLMIATGDHYAAWANHRLSLPPNKRTSGAFFGGIKTLLAYAGAYAIAPFLQGTGWLIREIGMTVTSPKRAISETYNYVKEKTGSRILGGIAAFFLRVVPLVAVALTVGLPAVPVLLGKVGGGYLASAASAIKSGLGYAGGWIASKFGASVAAKSAASATANFSVSVAPVFCSLVGANFVFNAISSFIKLCWSGIEKAIQRLKPNETVRPPNADAPKTVDTFVITAESSPRTFRRYRELFVNKGLILGDEGMTVQAMDALLASAPDKPAAGSPNSPTTPIANGNDPAFVAAPPPDSDNPQLSAAPHTDPNIVATGSAKSAPPNGRATPRPLSSRATVSHTADDLATLMRYRKEAGLLSQPPADGTASAPAALGSPETDTPPTPKAQTPNA